MSRLDKIKYDAFSTEEQKAFQEKCRELEGMIETRITCPRSRSEALTKLEEVYMWIGKGIRNNQVKREAEMFLKEDASESGEF